MQNLDAQHSVRPMRLLGVWAHPDDEAYLAAGLMAQTIRSGGSVTIVAVTDGEGGFGDDDVRPDHVRAAQRRSELIAAMAEIGVDDVRFLGVADGGVTTARAADLVSRIADTIVEVEPDVVVTFGPDGITGHDDHIACSSLVTAAWSDAGIGWLWYAAKTTGWLDEWRPLHDELGVWMTEEPTGVDPGHVDMVVRLEGVELDQKRRVLAAHGSQTQGVASAMGEDTYRRWICEEAFRSPTAAELAEADAVVSSSPDRDLVVSS